MCNDNEHNFQETKFMMNQLPFRVVVKEHVLVTILFCTKCGFKLEHFSQYFTNKDNISFIYER